ncbi:ATP-binding protein [Oceanibaculum pacificum]|uniref:histidine kinase n=1 Tax=Oceanibaculum pacificum TaxID=580166 RepID=A0A154VSJ0_9PROT|nr:ATP-binding protein [Oceanibaculum pacificum]KZD04272.1 hypothetical protein AUP43_12270 [Oceanibaculum pacificum]
MKASRIVTYCGVALSLAITAAVSLSLWQHYNDAYQQARQIAGNLATALAQHTRQTITTYDRELLDLSKDIPGEAVFQEELHETNRRLLTMHAADTLGVVDFFLTDNMGKLLVSSHKAERLAGDLSSHPSFTGHAGAVNRGLVIVGPSHPVPGLSAPEQAALTLSRPLTTWDGRFAGIVGVSLSLEYLQRFYASLEVGENGTLGLFTLDGEMLVRDPPIKMDPAAASGVAQIFGNRAEERPNGEMMLLSPLDTKLRLIAYRTVPEYPLLAFVGLSADDFLADWLMHTLFYGFVLLVIVTTLIVFSRLLGKALHRQNRNLEKLNLSEGRARRQAEQLSYLAAMSGDMIAIRDVDALLNKITDVARELIGAHQAVLSLSANAHFAQTIHGISLSEKYAAWRDYKEEATGEGIYRLVCENNQPMRLTQAELEAHPAFLNFGAAKDRHPPMNGWIAVPLIDKEGGNLGVLQLTDRYEGDFVESDIILLQQLAFLGASAIENARLYTALADSQLDFVEAERIARLGTWRWNADNDSAVVSPVMAQMLGLEDADTALRIEGRQMRRAIHPDDYRRVIGLIEEARQTGIRGATELRLVHPSGRERICWTEYHLQHDAAGQPIGMFGVIQDITERRDTEERLRQAQKMDAIGQLTGGVAHDFNNLLQVIIGNLDLALEARPAVETGAEEMRLALSAAERAADLTRKLLAFSRKQPLQPDTLDMNRVIRDMGSLLNRLLPPSISVETVLSGGLWLTSADRSQLENVLVNLAVNARDAMPEGGKLTIETGNGHLSDDYAAIHDAQAGQYVMIAVTDTGSGMPASVLSRAFDPFFTTKPDGQGTGLGLSMAYGFVKQSGGHIKIYSEVGHGTTVKIYLPRVHDAAPAAVDPLAPENLEPRGRGETILVVEDEDMVRRTVERILHDLGYRSIAVSTGAEAVAALSADPDGIALMFSDVVLPRGLMGHDLVAAVRALRPDLRILFTSGFTENSIIHQGKLDSGVHLISKPYKKIQLARKLRALLDAPDTTYN